MKKSIILVSSILIIIFNTSCNQKPAKKSLFGSRPNIILVITDDEGKGDLSCLGNKVLQTPNIDSMYALSTRFTDFHVSPMCAPTRAAIMSGTHEFRSGVTWTAKARENMALSTTTIAEVLKEAGYETGIFGKWHLGDFNEYLPHNRGFIEEIVHGAGGVGQVMFGDFPGNCKNTYFDPYVMHNDIIVKTKGFCTDVFLQLTMEDQMAREN
ncbi:sulfatase-like hydrolase/transferase [Bacteroidota bacterium]